MVQQSFPNLAQEDSNNKKEGWHKKITQRLLTSYGNKQYYIGSSQSTVYGIYQICLLRQNLSVHPVMVTFFQLTIPAARALLGPLPDTLIAADSHQESCWAKEPKTIPLERTTTDMV